MAPDDRLCDTHRCKGIDGIVKTMTLPDCRQVAHNTWNLRINDNAIGDTGYTKTWSMRFRSSERCLWAPDRVSNPDRAGLPRCSTDDYPKSRVALH